jgi:two-component system nitrogen regulation sensor histidine kinase GlnL
MLATAERDALGRPAGDVFRTGEGALLERALAGESPPYDVEVTARAGDGREVPLLLRTSLVHDRGGRAVGLVALFNDLTRLKRHDQDLRRIERLASLGEFSAGMAHEIRNPLAGIATTAELLAKRVPEGDPSRGLLSMIVEEVRRLNRLIEDLLRFARPAAPQFTPLSIHRVLDRCVSLLAARAHAKHVVIERRYGGDVPTVELDQAQMTQVFLNLVKNALEASPAFGTITLATEHGEGAAAPSGGGGRERGEHVVRVRIVDRGPGIARDHLEKVWNPFFTTKPSGTGLGLPICQRIVAEHRGRIAIESQEGKGTEVLIELPAPFYGEREVPATEAIERLTDIYG